MDFFNTDWAAMTLNDWIGLVMTVATLLLMIWAYVYALNPKNKEDLEKRRFLPFEEDEEIHGKGEKNE